MICNKTNCTKIEKFLFMLLKLIKKPANNAGFFIMKQLQMIA
jgi:hypothetical protein